MSDLVFSGRNYDKYRLVVLIESYHRPFSFRIVEYIAFGILRIIAPQKARLLTIGINQLQSHYWASYLHSIGIESGFFGTVSACENLTHAIGACKWYLDSKAFTFNDHESLSRIYTGSKNAYYEGLFVYAFTECVRSQSPNTRKRNDFARSS